MSALAWVLAGIVAYWLVVVALRSRGLLPEYVHTQGPLLTLHTGRGRALLEWLARPKRFWRAWANFGIGVALVVMAMAFVFLVVTALARMRSTQQTAVTRPRNVLVIPGVNEFLPLSVAPEILFGLAVGLVVHEGGHGLLCRVEDIDIRSMGLVLFALLPIGAFVEPDEDSRRAADRGGQTRMFAAGVTNNFAVTVLAFGLLFGPVAGSMAVAPGAHVGAALDGSPADGVGIERGDRITAVAGTPVESNDDLGAVLADTSSEVVAVELNGEETVEVERSLTVVGVVPGAPPHVERNDTIVAVDGTPVRTSADLRRAFENATVATVRTADGEASTFPVGAYAQVVEGGPLDDASGLAPETVVITRVAGQRVLSGEDLDRVMETTGDDQRVAVELYVDGQPREVDVTLGASSRGDFGLLGVSGTRGYTGILVDDFGVRTYPAGLYLSALGGDERIVSSPIQRTLLMLTMPVAGVAGGLLPFNFAGFTGGVARYYVATGPLGFAGRWLFLLANLLFWTGWINFNLAFFNCIPGYPLDGGHILRNATEAVVSRLPFQNRRQVTRTVTTAVGLTMLASLGLMLFGQGLLVG